jgi:nucleoside-diphosphate-sugar epimerase
MHDVEQALPHHILIIGASGPIGRALVTNLVGQHCSSADRIVLLQRGKQCDYSLIARWDADLMEPQALAALLGEEPEAVVYLAGVSAETAQAQPVVGQEIHVNGFSRVLEVMPAFRNPSIVVYASSTAVHGAQTAYATQKAEAESRLLVSSTAGTCLRFPTVLPRRSTQTRTSFLDEAMRQLSSGNEFRWPVALDRRVRLMSATAAARHIATAIKLGPTFGRRVLDLPATITTPRNIYSAAGSGDPLVAVQPDLDKALEDRIVDIDSSETARLGFPPAESVDQLLLAATSQLLIS